MLRFDSLIKQLVIATQVLWRARNWVALNSGCTTTNNKQVFRDRHALLMVMLAICLVPGIVQAGGPVISPYVYPTPPGVQNAALYFELHNKSNKPLVLTGATADGVGEVQIHGHMQIDGMVGMRQQAQVTVNAGEMVSFAPGGYHLMLLGLRGPLRAGDSIHLQLYFAGEQGLSVTAPVIELGSQPQPAVHGSMQHGMGHGEH